MKAFVIRTCVALVVASAVLFLLTPPTTGAGQRVVTVNGVVLGPQELAAADVRVGFRLPDGHYWYDVASGHWGPAGGPALGRLPPQRSQHQHGWSVPNSSAGTGTLHGGNGLRIDPQGSEPDARHLRPGPDQGGPPQEEDWAGLRAHD